MPHLILQGPLPDLQHPDWSDALKSLSSSRPMPVVSLASSSARFASSHDGDAEE